MVSENISSMSILEIVDYITKTYHEPIRKNLVILDALVASIVLNDVKTHPELVHLGVLFSQFKIEVLRHVTKEDFITFPTILKYQRIYNDDLINLSDNFEVMDKLINDVAMQNEHTDFELYLTSIIQLLD
jgi:iron-sulfur cluster repair protein YtfE (RIC family)